MLGKAFLTNDLYTVRLHPQIDRGLDSTRNSGLGRFYLEGTALSIGGVVVIGLSAGLGSSLFRVFFFGRKPRKDSDHNFGVFCPTAFDPAAEKKMVLVQESRPQGPVEYTGLSVERGANR